MYISNFLIDISVASRVQDKVMYRKKSLRGIGAPACTSTSVRPIVEIFVQFRMEEFNNTMQWMCQPFEPKKWCRRAVHVRMDPDG